MPSLPRFVHVAAPTGGQRGALAERTIAVVRIGAASGAALLLALGGPDARSYPLVALVVVSGALLYTVAMVTRRFRLKPELSSALDLSFSLAIIAATGAGRSVAIGLLFLVLGASALRFPPRVSGTIAALGSSGVAVVIFTVPRPDLDLTLRAELATGWAASLLLAAVLVAALSGFELREREALLIERERAASLGQEDAARRRTLRMVAHDLTAPLAAVEGIARTLQDPPGDLRPEDRREALDLLVEHASHLRGFAASLRDVANAGDLTKLGRPRSTPLDLVPFLDGICRAHTFSPSRSVELDAATGLPPLATDPEKLRRVLVNLIDNATRHSPTGAPVVVEARTGGDIDPDTRTGSSTARNTGTIAVAVVDGGPGVADEDLQRMFRPEWQGSDDVGESGLGLWIVAELVNDLGGTVQAEAADGGGLRVTVTLPHAPD